MQIIEITTHLMSRAQYLTGPAALADGWTISVETLDYMREFLSV
jgi:hypothetical protein